MNVVEEVAMVILMYINREIYEIFHSFDQIVNCNCPIHSDI